MSENEQKPAMDRFCLLDIGSTTTKAVLVEWAGGWKHVRREAPTTVEKPYEDVTAGVVQALSALEEAGMGSLVRDGRPALPLFATSSAGGGLAVVVMGLVRKVTAESGERVALGGGAIIQDAIALDDGRSPYAKILRLQALRPDMVLLCGGFDGGAVYGPVFLAELLRQADMRPKHGGSAALPVIYAGNVDAREPVEQILADRYMYVAVPNLRPESHRENLEPGRNAIHDVFMDHVMSQAPGYEKFTQWVSAPVLPTPAAVAQLLAHMSVDMGARILAIDIGGATTDVFTAHEGKVVRTVSANLGMSYSILNVVQQAGIEAVQGLAGFPIEEVDLLDRLGNKYLHPTSLPATVEDTAIECAVASLAIRGAVRDHFQIMKKVALSRTSDDLGWHMFGKKRKGKKDKTDSRAGIDISEYDIVIGSGGKLSHSPRDTAAAMLINALRPTKAIELAVDSEFIFPQIGVLSESDRDLAVRLLHEIGLVRLGTYVPCSGKGKAGKTAAAVNGERAVACGDVALVGELDGEERDYVIRGEQLKPGGDKQVEVKHAARVIVDAREEGSEEPCPWFLPGDYVPPQREGLTQGEAAVVRGTIVERRELALSGEVFVEVGQELEPETLVAKSTRVFRRPFFVRAVSSLGVEPGRMAEALEKGIGEDIAEGEVLATYKPQAGDGDGGLLGSVRARLASTKVFRSPVSGTVERVMPDGTIIIREEPERTKEARTVNVVEQLRVPPEHVKALLKCAEGQEVEKGQTLALKGHVADLASPRCVSPVRGKIRQIDLQFGVIIIDPLHEELELKAWLSGKVTAVSERGCTVEAEGVTVAGVWGRGEACAGVVCCGEPVEGAVMVRETATEEDLRALGEAGVAALIVGGVHLRDVEAVTPEYAVVVTERFGAREMRAEVREVLRAYEGRMASVDPTTQLRAGVVRPRVVLAGEN